MIGSFASASHGSLPSGSEQRITTSVVTTVSGISALLGANFGFVMSDLAPFPVHDPRFGEVVVLLDRSAGAVIGHPAVLEDAASHSAVALHPQQAGVPDVVGEEGDT